MEDIVRTHVALFAGLGGFIASCDRAGYKTIFATDIEKHCVQTIKHTFPDVPVRQEDITRLSLAKEIGVNQVVDLLSAGFPCQSFSTAGTNLGFDDERGKLFFEIPRLIKELTNPPKVVLLENVPNLKIFDNGSRLQVVIHELRLLGYWVSDSQAVILKSRDVSGTPQNRDRLYIIAYHSSYFKRNYFQQKNIIPNPKPDLQSFLNLDEKQDEGLYLDKKSKYFEMINQSVAKNGTERLYQIRRIGVRACPPNTCPTLTANMGGGGHNVPFVKDKWGIRRLSVSECLRMQGYNDTEISFPESIPRTARYTMIGNAIHAGTVEKVIRNISFDRERVSNDRMALPAQ